MNIARDDGVKSTDVAVSSLRQETETRPPVSAWGRLGSARSDIINLSSQTGGRQTGERQAGDTQTGDRQPGNTQPGDSQGGESGSRCNGKLQRTKRIEPEPEPADDKDSIASVTIISVPSGIVTPLTSSEPREHREPSLIKQTSLPPPSSHLRNKHLGKRSQSPNSGWL